MSKITFENPKYKVKVKMESDECFCGITAFYEFLAKQLGFGEKVYVVSIFVHWFFIIGKICGGLRRRCSFRYYRGSFWIFLYFNGICRIHNAV